MTSNNANVTVWYFLINKNHRPIYDRPFKMNLPKDATIADLEMGIGDRLRGEGDLVKPMGFRVRQCTDRTIVFAEGNMNALESTVKSCFTKNQIRKPSVRSKIKDLRLGDDESLLVEVSAGRSIRYLTVDHGMRLTCGDVLKVVATDISELVDCAYVKRKSRNGEVTIWRSTIKKLSVCAQLGDLTEMIDQIDLEDPEQITRLPGTTLATDVDDDEVLIVQVLASDDDGEGDDRLLPLPSKEDLNKDYEETYSKISSVKSPSTNSKSAEYSQNQITDRDIIYDGLRAPITGAPNTNAPPIYIYHPIFWKFTRGANDPSMVPDSDFLKLVREFMANSCKVGYDEQTANKSMRSYLKDILEQQIPVESNDDETRPDGVIMFGRPGARIPMVIAEFKRTLGEGGCDPSIQAGNSMRHKLGQSESKLIVDKCCCPVFMLAGGGPWLCVLGGVFINRFIVQRLTDMMWIGFGTTHEDSRVYQVAKVLFALKESLRDLKDFYEFVVNTKKIPDFKKFHDPHPRHFPYPRSFVDNENTVVIFEYLGRLEADMTCVTFLARIKNTEQMIVVKFVDRYGAEVHQFLAEQGHAPQLHYYGPLPERTIYDSSEPAPAPQKPMNAGYQRLGPAVAPEMKMVVMEYIPGSKPRLDNRDLSRNKISTVLEKLHMNGYVFGDLRGPNIMFDANEEVKFIDFDWAGRYDIKDLPPDQQERIKERWTRLSDAGKDTAEEQADYASYPIGISLTITWAKGAGSWLPILPNHDTDMLTRLYERWSS